MTRIRAAVATVAIAVAVGLLSGCEGAVDDDGAAARATATPGRSVAAATPSPDGPAPPSDRTADPGEDTEMTVEPGLRRIVTLALADLSARVGASVDEIRVVSAEAVTWPDTSLGCPQPDMRYAQVPQDGARVVLEVRNKRYRYHSGGQTTEPFLCELAPVKQPRPLRPLDPRLTDPPRRQTP